MCGIAVQSDGCCVVEPGTCVDDIDSGTCFFEVSESTELFVSNLACSEVPMCSPIRNIPTLSNWALIVLTAVLVLIGVWGITRKRVSA